MIAPRPLRPLALLLALLLAAPAGAATLTTKVVTPRRLTVGDRFDLVLDLQAPASSQVLGPLADSLGVFVVTGAKPAAAPTAGRGEHRLTLAGFRPGRQRLPVFTFLVRTSARVDTLRSDTGSVLIARTMPKDMKDIHDLKPPESFPNHWLWIIPLALLLAAVLAWLAARLLRGLRRARERAEAALPPWDEALGALDTMPWQDWLGAGQVKRYYYALSQVLKRYIERRFEFNAVEQTTTEILNSMRTHRTPMRDEVQRFLLRSDFVKYAKMVPPDEEMRSAITEVREFVNRTTPQEPPAAAPAGPAAAEGPAPAGRQA
jgi:hypothetical protein